MCEKVDEIAVAGRWVAREFPHLWPRWVRVFSVSMRLKVERNQGFWALVVLAAVVIMVFGVWQMTQSRSPGTIIGDPSYVTDLKNDRKLVGIGNDVFFGQVVSKTGQSETDGPPATQFNVTVLETLKGDLSGTVSVNQQGADLSDGNSFRMIGDSALLSPEKSYLFVTRRHGVKGYNTLVPGYGNIDLDVADNASREEVLRSDDANDLRERFNSAIAEQVEYDPSS